MNILLNTLRKHHSVSIKEQNVVERFFKSISFPKIPKNATLVVINQPDPIPYGPFFPQLKKLTITSLVII